MIVFDVDGTLVGGEPIDWASFRAAFADAAGFSPANEFYEDLEEVTAQAIVHQALGNLPLEEKKEIEREVCRGFLRHLKEAHVNDPNCFPALEGAVALIGELQERGFPLAIATGDWRETILFKLAAAGISIEGIPMVTSSEFYSRADIIKAAVADAGRPLEEAIYVGDGVWDLRTCRKLGIPFVGVGHRRDQLLKEAAIHVLIDLSPPGFWQIHETIRSGCSASVLTSEIKPAHPA
jgi:phosphoglycolate phosphatase-like HAD superfamily hydrolase